MSDPAPPPDAVPLDTQELPGELYLNVHVRVDLRGGREQVTAHVAVDAQGHPVADPGMANCALSAAGTSQLSGTCSGQVSQEPARACCATAR